jgi:tRNA(Arg) A34 adenosine deaminase TadA
MTVQRVPHDYISLAYEEARKSCLQKRYGAVIVYRGKVLASAHNYPRRLLHYDRTANPGRVRLSAHAEEACINKVHDKQCLKQAYMIVVRLDVDSKAKPCKSCQLCVGLIGKYKVGKIYLLNHSG